MKTIHRYPIDTREAGKDGVLTIRLPGSADILRVGIRPLDGQPSLWALLDQEDADPNWEVWVRIAGTGHQLPDSTCAHHYLGSFDVGALVFHAFKTYERALGDGSRSWRL